MPDTDNRDDPEEFACPLCDSGPNEPCTNTKGKPVKDHKARSALVVCECCQGGDHGHCEERWCSWCDCECNPCTHPERAA